MKSYVGFIFFVLATLIASGTAYAACQTCLNQLTVNATCWVVGSTDFAEYGACWEVPEYDENGQLISERCAGSAPVPGECNQPTGGGGEPGGPFDKDGGDGGGECQTTELGCPAQCSSCT